MLRRKAAFHPKREVARYVCRRSEIWTITWLPAQIFVTCTVTKYAIPICSKRFQPWDSGSAVSCVLLVSAYPLTFCTLYHQIFASITACSMQLRAPSCLEQTFVPPSPPCASLTVMSAVADSTHLSFITCSTRCDHSLTKHKLTLTKIYIHILKRSTYAQLSTTYFTVEQSFFCPRRNRKAKRQREKTLRKLINWQLWLGSILLT